MESFLCSRIIQGGKFNEKSFVSEAEILESEAMLALLLLDVPERCSWGIEIQGENLRTRGENYDLESSGWPCRRAIALNPVEPNYIQNEISPIKAKSIQSTESI